MGGKADTPQIPDYYGLAQQQGQISSSLLGQQTAANRPNTSTPWGSQSWTPNANGTWTGTEQLNPVEQQTLNTQQGVQSGLAGSAANLAGGADASLFNGGINYSNVPSVQGGTYYTPQASNAVWDQFQQMQKPLQDQQTQSQQAQLEAQGLRPGDAAYDTAMRNLSNTQYGQTQSAEDQAVLAGEQEAQTMQGMDVTAQQAALGTTNSEAQNQLNLFNSLYGNTGINNPSQPTAASSGVAQTPDLSGAGMNMYNSALNNTNAQNASSANTAAGVTALLGSALMAFSDRRLKRNIRRAGSSPRGYPWYKFTYIWGEASEGVMSDEVDPSIVSRHHSGYDCVDYSKV